jgi:O-antigen/teichoic acid export membrane protein
MALRQSALFLAGASGIEYGMQLAIPVILVRWLDVETFGQYRFIWLLAATSLAVGQLFMPQSLFYFLPRYAAKKGIIVGNTLIYLTVAGFITGAILSTINPFLSGAVRELTSQTNEMSAIFLGLWIIASAADFLPTANGHALWQAKVTVAIAVLRSTLLVVAAITTGSIFWVASVLSIIAATKISALVIYVISNENRPRIGFDRHLCKQQLAYALPFAIGNMFFLLRVQADQWVVASMTTPADYAVFAVASALMPVATLIRQPVYNAMMPRLNTAYASAKMAEIAELIKRSNAVTSMVLIPVASALITMAPELVTLIYTDKYNGAVPVMQIYLLGMIMNVFAVGHVLPAFNKGRFATINNGCCLFLSVTFSCLGLRWFGITGAAFGSVAMFAVSELWSAAVVARILRTRVSQLFAWRALVPPLAGGASGILVSYIAAQMLDASLAQTLVVKAIAFFCTFLAIFCGTGGLKQVRPLVFHTKVVRT